MKAVLTKIQVLSLLWVLPALANDVGLHNSSAQPTRALLVADTSTSIKNVHKVVWDECLAIENPSFNNEKNHAASNVLYPGLVVFNQLGANASPKKGAHAQTKVGVQPKHGQIKFLELRADFDNPDLPLSGSFTYIPNKDFLGDDHVLFNVTINNETYQVNYLLRVVMQEDSACEGTGYESSKDVPNLQVSLARVGWAK